MILALASETRQFPAYGKKHANAHATHSQAENALHLRRSRKPAACRALAHATQSQACQLLAHATHSQCNSFSFAAGGRRALTLALVLVVTRANFLFL